jgi:hypothetical protein
MDGLCQCRHIGTVLFGIECLYAHVNFKQEKMTICLVQLSFCQDALLNKVMIILYSISIYRKQN